MASDEDDCRSLLDKEDGEKDDTSKDEVVKTDQADATEPKDRYNLIYLAMILFGGGFLFPFNSFVAAADYFLYIYPDYYPEVVFPFMYMYVTLFTIVLNAVVVERFPLQWRLWFGYVTMFIGLLVIPLLDIGIHNCTLSSGSAFGLTIASIVVVSVGAGVQQSSFYGLAGMLSGRHVQAILLGEAVCGIVVVVNRVLTKATLGSERVSTIVFLVISMVFLVICAVCLFFVRFSPYLRYHVSLCSQKQAASQVHYKSLKQDSSKSHPSSESVEDKSSGTVVGESTGAEATNGDYGDDGVINLSSNQTGKIEDKERTKGNQNFTSCLSALRDAWKDITNLHNLRSSLLLRWTVIKLVWPLIIAVFFNFFVTLLLFPGIATLVQDCGLDGWTPIVIVAVFNVADFIAKVAALVPIKWKDYQLVGASLARIVLVPLLLLAVSPSPSQPVVGSPWFAGAVVLVLGATNGYFGTVPMVLAPSHVPEELREVAGIIMSLFVLGGLALGATLAYALLALTHLEATIRCSNNGTDPFSCHQTGGGDLVSALVENITIAF